MIAYIDSDPLIYSSCFVAEYYLYAVNDMEFKYKKQAEEYRIATGQTDVEIVKTPILEDISVAIKALQNSLRRLLNDCEQAFELDQYILVVSSDTNFRRDIDPNYKVGRTKPQYYRAVKDYLISLGSWHQAGLEADDIIARRHFEDYLKDKNSSCIVTIDKDLYNIPGWHFDFRNKELSYVEEDKAQEYFARQLLSGDRTDNIAGIYRCGPETSKGYVRDLQQTYGKDFIKILKGVYDIWAEKDPINYTHRFPQTWKLLDVGGIYEKYLHAVIS